MQENKGTFTLTVDAEVTSPTVNITRDILNAVDARIRQLLSHGYRDGEFNLGGCDVKWTTDRTTSVQNCNASQCVNDSVNNKRVRGLT